MSVAVTPGPVLLYARNPFGFRDGQVEEFKSATLSPVFNDVGSWQVVMDRRAPMAAQMQSPGWGLIAIRDGQILLSGPVMKRRHDVDATRQELTLSGYTDEAVLKWRLASASPGDTVGPYTTQVSDDRSGLAGAIIAQYININAGTTAITPRQVPFMGVTNTATSIVTVKGSARWDNLLAFLQPLATSGGVGFRVVQNGPALQAQVYSPRDLTTGPTAVRFSLGLGNLASFSYESTAPEANYVYVGGTGTGTARTIKEYPDSAAIALYGRREGDFVNSSNSSDAVILGQDGLQALTDHSEQATLSITPIERPGVNGAPGSVYGVDYKLGDKVIIQLEGPATSPYAGANQIVDVIRRVDINVSPDGTTVTPTIGTGARNDVGLIFRAVRALKRQTSLLGRA